MTLTFASKQSPYVNKLDALLTFSALKNVTYEGGTIQEAPRGKLPYIALDGTFIPDSELAYNSCVSKDLVRCLDKKAVLNEKEIALSRSIQALVERNLIEMLTYERQVYPHMFKCPFLNSPPSWIENWYLTKDKYLADVPALIRNPIAYIFVYRPVSLFPSTR